MIGWRALLDGARPLQASAPQEDYPERAVQRLRSVSIPHTSFRYPKSTMSFAQVKSALAAVLAQDPRDALLLTELLRHPLRAYPLEGPETRLALVGAALRIGSSPRPRW